ncbi:MAG: PQQ-binding-like beta-propeller repeat protein [Chloroflexi bacterium]|nr:PQQ-binding-like beta-propeller repeat protein [Chloroflexota bacterium]
MGVVYRARDTNFKAIRLVAVKEMIIQVIDPLVRKDIFKIFEREANILASLSHPAIPHIYNYFTVNERAYLILEFVNGKDLDKILAETTTFFPEEQILGWAIEFCDVLQFLHSHKPEPIIFRDVKPSNMMVNLQNHVILVDFGIAKHFEGGQKNTMVGTQGYSPPDQYRGEATPKVDIYALGATLHHLLTLRDPRLEAPFSFDERPIKEINKNVSDELIAVIDRALQYEPEARFESAEEFKLALLTAGQKTGSLAKTSIPTAVISRAGGVKPLWTFDCEDEIRGTPLFHEGSLYVGSYDNNLYSLDASSGEFNWKYPADGGIPGRPAIHENNIYFGSEDKRVHVISSRSGKVVWTYYTEAPVRSSPRIAQGHVFVGSDDMNLHAISLSSGNLAWKSETSSPVRSTPFVTDSLVYFGSEEGDFYCLDFRGEIKWRFRAKRAITSSPIVVKDAVYFTSMDSSFYALDATSGWVIWRFRMGKGSISTPYIIENYIFTGAADGVIYCIDQRTSKEVWRYSTDHQVTGSPVVYKDSVYCGSVDHSLYCLEYSTGRLRWQFATEGAITGTPIIYDDIVYFGSNDKKVYALLA